MIETSNLAALLLDPSRVSEVKADAVPVLLGQLEQLRAILWTRLFLSVHPNNQQEDRLLTAEQAAPILGTTEDWIRRHRDTLPFTVRLSTGQIRYSVLGIKRFIATRMGR